MTRIEEISIIDNEGFMIRIFELKEELVKQINRHTRLKRVYRYTAERTSSIGKSYIQSCKKIRGVNWAAQQTNRLLHKGILHLEDSEFDRDYMVKVIKSLPMKDSLKQELINDFLED